MDGQLSRRFENVRERNERAKVSLRKRALWGVVVLLSWAWVAAFLWGIRCYIVTSGSMEPAIPTGSICLVDVRADYEKIQTGDVIVFLRGRGLVTHRVVEVTAEGLETKGDANERSDGITTGPENFRGKTIGYVPYVGYVLVFCRRFLWQWSTAILLGGVLMILFVRKTARQEETN